MTLNIGLQTLVSNLGVRFEDLMLIVMNLTAFIAYAKRVDIGIMVSFLMNAVCLMIFIALGSAYDYSNALRLTLVFLVLLALTLYSNMHGAAEGVV